MKEQKTKNKTKKKHTIVMVNDHTVNDHTVIQSTTAGKVNSPETTNCTSVHKHVIKYD